MSDIVLSQTEADELLQMEKIRVDDKAHQFPQIRGRLNIPLISRDGRNKFYLDISVAQIAIKKVTFQNRGRSVIVLARLDTMGKHTNPDGNILSGSHLHLYKEGFADRWAYPLPSDFSDVSNLLLTLDEFMEYCQIVETPIIQGSSV